jgi:hypothetical protein
MKLSTILIWLVLAAGAYAVYYLFFGQYAATGGFMGSIPGTGGSAPAAVPFNAKTATGTQQDAGAVQYQAGTTTYNPLQSSKYAIH